MTFTESLFYMIYLKIFLLHFKVIVDFIYIFPFLHYLPSWSIPGDWIEFPVLYSKASLLIHSACNSLQLLTPNSESITLPLPPALAFSSSLKSLSVFLHIVK